MKPITDFLNNLVFLFVAMGFICGALLFRSCGSISAAPRDKVELGFAPTPFNLIGDTNSGSRSATRNEYNRMIAQIEEQERELARLRSKINQERGRANGLAIDLSEVREQLAAKNTELTETKRALVDSSVVLRELRADHVILQFEYDEEVQSHMESLEKLLSAGDTIQEQRTVIKRMEQEVVVAKAEAKRTLIALIVLVSMILIGSVLFWLQTKGIVDFTRFIRKKVNE